MKYQTPRTCSNTEFSLLMNGTEREIRTAPFNFFNCNYDISNRFFKTCKGITSCTIITDNILSMLLVCQMEVLLDTIWLQSYINTQLTLPCMISEGKLL